MISKMMEIYSISLPIYKTVANTVYVLRYLTLNDTIVLPEHPVHTRFTGTSCTYTFRVSQNALLISLKSVKNFVCVKGTERLLTVRN